MSEVEAEARLRQLLTLLPGMQQRLPSMRLQQASGGYTPTMPKFAGKGPQMPRRSCVRMPRHVVVLQAGQGDRPTAFAFRPQVAQLAAAVRVVPAVLMALKTIAPGANVEELLLGDPSLVLDAYAADRSMGQLQTEVAALRALLPGADIDRWGGGCWVCCFRACTVHDLAARWATWPLGGRVEGILPMHAMPAHTPASWR